MNSLEKKTLDYIKEGVFKRRNNMKRDWKIKRIVSLISSLVWLLILIVGLPICLLGIINWILSAWLF